MGEEARVAEAEVAALIEEWLEKGRTALEAEREANRQKTDLYNLTNELGKLLVPKHLMEGGPIEVWVWHSGRTFWVRREGHSYSIQERTK